jgi:trehalose-6-phosphate synthase
LLRYLPNYLSYEPAWWQHYQNVNRTFAEKVLETVHEGDLVWVHDYQLMLLPAMLRAAAPNLKIGFFLHTPFPRQSEKHWEQNGAFHRWKIRRPRARRCSKLKLELHR